MIVVDASALIELLLHTPHAEAVSARLFSGSELAAPHLLDAEVIHALRRAALAGAITPAHGEAAIAITSDLPITRHDHLPLLPRIWALRHNVSAYNATYVALAEALGAELLTADARLARATGHSARVTLVTSVH